ncbi:hypothetical protein Plhal703r1_c02g0008931 [Plasmopara halstedii]
MTYQYRQARIRADGRDCRLCRTHSEENKFSLQANGSAIQATGAEKNVDHVDLRNSKSFLKHGDQCKIWRSIRCTSYL